jgi:hypothetical protein
MSILTDQMGIDEKRAIKIAQDVEDLMSNHGTQKMHSIGTELKVLSEQYSGAELAFAGYMYGRIAQNLVHICGAFGMKIEIIEVKNP